MIKNIADFIAIVELKYSMINNYWKMSEVNMKKLRGKNSSILLFRTLVFKINVIKFKTIAIIYVN